MRVALCALAALLLLHPAVALEILPADTALLEHLRGNGVEVRVASACELGGRPGKGLRHV
jgi:hypothetical protein